MKTKLIFFIFYLFIFNLNYIYSQEEWNEDSCLENYLKCLDENPQIAFESDPKKAFETNPDKAAQYIADGTIDINDQNIKSELENSISKDLGILNNNPALKSKWLETYNIKDNGGKILAYDKSSGVIKTGPTYSTQFKISDPKFKDAIIENDGSVTLANLIKVSSGTIEYKNGELVIDSPNIDVSKGNENFKVLGETRINDGVLEYIVSKDTIVNINSGFIEFSSNNGNGNIQIFQNNQKIANIDGTMKLYNNGNFVIGPNSKYHNLIADIKYSVSAQTAFKLDCGGESISCVKIESGKYIQISLKNNNNMVFESNPNFVFNIYTDKISDSSKLKILDLGLNFYMQDRNGIKYRGDIMENSNINLIHKKNNGEFEVFLSNGPKRESYIVSGENSIENIFSQMQNPSGSNLFKDILGEGISSSKSLSPSVNADCEIGKFCKVISNNGKYDEFILKEINGQILYCKNDMCWDNDGFVMIEKNNGRYERDSSKVRNTIFTQGYSQSQSLLTSSNLNWNIGHVGNEMCGRYVGKVCEKNNLDCARQNAWDWTKSPKNEPLAYNANGLNLNQLEIEGKLRPNDQIIFINPRSNYLHKVNRNACNSNGNNCGTHVVLYVGNGKIAHQLGTTRYDANSPNGFDSIDRLVNQNNYVPTLVSR